MNLGDMVKFERVKRGLTLRGLAKAVGVTPGYISQLERGITDSEPTKQMVKRIAVALADNEEESEQLEHQFAFQLGKLPKDVELELSEFMRSNKMTGKEAVAILSAVANMAAMQEQIEEMNRTINTHKKI